MVDVIEIRRLHKDLIKHLSSRDEEPLVKDYLDYVEYELEDYIDPSESSNLDFVSEVPFRLNRYLQEFNFNEELTHEIKFYIKKMMKYI
ncbi:hypothetical protein [Halocola ammonii]